MCCRLPQADEPVELDYIVDTGEIDSRPVAIRAACFSPCGKRIALTHSSTGAVRIVDSRSEALLMRETGVATPGPALTIENMERKHSVGHTDTMVGHTDTVVSLAFSPDGRLLAQGSKDHTLTVVDISTPVPKLIFQYKGHKGQICAVSFSPDGQRLVAGSADSTASVHTLHAGTEEAASVTLNFDLHDRWIRAVDFSPDGRRVAIGCDDTTASVWDVETGARLSCHVQGLHAQKIMAVRFVEDGERLIIGSADKKVSIVKLSEHAGGTGKTMDWERLFTVDCKHTEDSDVWTMAISKDGRRVVLGSSDSVVSVVDLVTGNKLLTLHDVHRCNEENENAPAQVGKSRGGGAHFL